MHNNHITRITRRGFHRRALRVAGGSLAGVAGMPAWGGRAVAADGPPSSGTTYPPGKYVDMHVHLGQSWNSRGAFSVDMLLNWMDQQEVSQAVVLPLVSPEAWFYPISTDAVLQQTRRHRDRLIPFCSIDPRTVNLGGFAGMLDLLRRYVDSGAKGFGEQKWGGRIDDPRNLELFRACGELKLPVLFHMDNIRNTDQPGLPGLEAVLKAVPDSNFIGHAQGWWASISGEVGQGDMGGYPKGPVRPGGAIDRLMDKYPNVYGDLSAGSGANAIRRDPEFGREFLIRRSDRLLFGTDKLMDRQSIPQFELLEGIDLPDDARTKIYRENARRLLELV